MTLDRHELYSQLTAALPDAAIKPHPTKSYLSTIKAQYVVDRLNMVFGIGSWHLKGEFIASNAGVLYKGTLLIPDYSIEIECTGFKAFPKNKDKDVKEDDIGDSYKSARTDALSKAASWIGVGNEVFKGEGNKSSKETMNVPVGYKPFLEVVCECAQKGISKDDILGALKGLLNH